MQHTKLGRFNYVKLMSRPAVEGIGIFVSHLRNLHARFVERYSPDRLTRHFYPHRAHDVARGETRTPLPSRSI